MISLPLGILGLLVAAAAWAVFTYNRFITLATRIQEAWADIDVQLKRRYDLIPNLVNTVKGYAAHEAGTLEKVTEMRVKAMGAQTVGDHSAADNALAGALKSLFAVAESYPDLKANQNFLELQRELSDTENKVQAARRFYNSVVQDFNAGIQMFPASIIAGFMKLAQKEFFMLAESEAAAKEPVKVAF